MIFKAALASQRWPSCPYKPLSFQTLRHPQFLSNFQSPKFKFSVSGKKNVRLFDAMKKTSVLSEKNVPLTGARIQIQLPKYYGPIIVNNLLCVLPSVYLFCEQGLEARLLVVLHM